MATKSRGWTRGHSGWAFGTALMFTLGIIFGLIWGNVLLGVVLAAAVSIGWLMAYESWRDRDDDGARL